MCFAACRSSCAPALEDAAAVLVVLELIEAAQAGARSTTSPGRAACEAISTARLNRPSALDGYAPQ